MKYLVILFAFITTCNAQQKPAPRKSPQSQAVKSNEPSPKDILEINGLMAALQHLSYHNYNSLESAPLTNERAVMDLDSVVNKGKSFGEKGKDNIQIPLLKKYYSPLNDILVHFTLFGGELSRFFYFQSPFSFSHLNNSLCLITPSMDYSSTFNTLRLDSKQRAAKVVQSAIFPSLQVFKPVLQNPTIKYIGVQCVYDCKDLTDDEKKPDEECVSLIIPCGACLKFVNGEITEEQLLALSDIYLKDKDMNVGVKKITLTQ